MIQPEIQCGFKIYFNNDYDINEITKVLGINPTHSATYSDSGYTCKTKVKRAGFWWYIIPGGRDYKPCWKVDEILTELFAPFSMQQIKWLNKTRKAHNGKISIDINIFVKDDFPELCFDGKNMRIINELDADINLNLNRDVESDN